MSGQEFDVLVYKGKLDISTIQFVLNHNAGDQDVNNNNSSDDSSLTSSPMMTNTTTTTSNTKTRIEKNRDQDDDDTSEEDDNSDEENDDDYKDSVEDNQERKKSVSSSTTGSNYTSPTISNSKSPSNTPTTSWSDQLSFVISSDGNLMVLGGGGSGGVGTGLAMVLQRKGNDDQWRTAITLDHQYSNGDKITQIALVPLYTSQLEYVIAIGYTSGYLRIFSTHGNLLLSQLFHKLPILKIKVKTTPIISSTFDTLSTLELSILYPNNIIASMSGVSLTTVLQVCYNQILRGDSTSQAQANLSFRKWSLDTIEKTRDFVFCGPFLGSPFRALPYGTTEHAVVRLVAVGRDPIVSYYYPSDDNGGSFSVAVALVSSVAAKLTNAVFSFAKNWWGGNSPPQQQQQQQQSQQPDVKIENPLPLSIRWSIIDEKREITSISLDPSGRYAAATDSLGRVLLIDVVNSLIIKIWKGYRDCQTAWIHCKEEDDDNQEEQNDKMDSDQDNSSVQTLEDIMPPKLLKKTSSSVGNYWRTYLVIYIGRRGYIEVWGMKHKQRIVFQKVGLGCRLLTSTIPSKKSTSNQQSLNLSTSQILSTIENYRSNCYLINSQGLVYQIQLN